jgi:tRNA 2-thiocytidine biosynthesis protein TtcA
MRRFFMVSSVQFIDPTDLAETSPSSVDSLSSKDDVKRQRLNKLQKRLRRLTGQAIEDFNMIQEGDKIMVCLSGGKDSYTMLEILLSLQISSPIKFEIVAVNLDQKQPDFPEHVLPAYLTARGVPFYILEKDTYSIVKELTPEGQTYCAVCSRLRRGNLYAFAQEIGATKVALGHHRDDIMATLMLNLFHNGRLKAMPPKLLSDDGKNILIRPLAYCKEKDIAEYAALKEFPIIPCNLCGSQANLQRAQVNQMLRDWDKQFPQRLDSMFTAIQNVAPSQLADVKLFDFESLEGKRASIAPKEVPANRLEVINVTL